MRMLVVAVAFVLAAPAAAAPPRAGALVPGTSLGNVRLGATTAEVRRLWGNRYGVCRACADPTWYFNYARFRPQGAGVSFRAGRVAAVFTLWRPRGWRAPGVRLGDPPSRVTTRYRSATTTTCDGYYVFTIGSGAARTDFYVYDEKVWGFGLRRPSVPPCR
jgi:hypothetical protein